MKTTVSSTPVFDFLAGGLRISLDENSSTPGPRTHILGIHEGLTELDIPHRIILASDMPLLGRFKRMSQQDYRETSTVRKVVVDIVRLGVGVYTGLNVLVRSTARSDVSIVYERVSVFQSMASFHRAKRRAIRAVESNGILSRETAHDRKGLILESIAAAIEKRVYRKADVIVAVSDALAAEIVSFANIDRAKILTVKNGVSSQFASKSSVSSCDGPKTIRIGFCGSIVDWQQLHLLINAVSDVVRVDPEKELYLDIVGDGPALPELRRQAAAQGIEDRVSFHGRLTHSEAVERMATWSIGYAGHRPSSSSTMYHSPLKLYEYASLGLSIIATASADARDLGSLGFNVKIFESQKELTELIASASALIGEKPDRERSQILAQELTWRRRMQEMLDGFASLRSPQC